MSPTLMTALVLLAIVPSGRDDRDGPVISVREAGGDYTVYARFVVPEPPDVVREVLTDYARMPRFMPDVRTSVVVGRGNRTARVEQEAVSKFMWFSKTVHLVLDVDEGSEVIAFRDRCTRSFRRYEGSWAMKRQGELTELTYQLVARPTFDVPGFVLRTLLNRDAVVMVDRLRTEIRARGAGR